MHSKMSAFQHRVVVVAIGVLLFFGFTSAASAQSNRLPLTTQYQVTKAVADLEQLSGLDDVWTAYLENRKEVSDDDRKVLGRTEEDMVALLEKSGNDLKLLRGLVSGNPKNFDDNMLRAIAESNYTPAIKKELTERLGARGGAAKVMQEAMSHLSVSDEIGTLQEKMKRINAGQHPRGDLTKRWKCALTAGVAAGTGVLCAGGIGPACGGAVGAALSFMWNCL
jgi:hypothetical protein